ncbi:putative ABC transporter [Pseudohyphozyma bogoriensis]|nr:putative ABC transporter [Pseudohyphozyma bogoriensis]
MSASAVPETDAPAAFIGEPAVDAEDRGRPFPKEEVHDLARQLSHHSQGTSSFNSLYKPGSNSALDPASANFDARAWVETILRLQARENGDVPLRQAGFSFRDLSVYGYGTDADYQRTVGNVPISLAGQLKDLVTGNKGRRVDILRDLDGVVRAGEMLVVLGAPGSGCSTFLKTIAGETNGLHLDEQSYINYQGISAKQMASDFRGEAIYSAEVDVHFPQLTVGDTLYFAAAARAPRVPPGGVSRKEYATVLRNVVMSLFGISHTINTIVGNDFIRGVSGGERKRVSIAETVLSGAPLAMWDNSTRGLDSANAIEFCKTLQMGADLAGQTAAVAIYQAPQAAFECFDKVTVLYEGRQIFFGRCDAAKGYFERLGFYSPPRQPTADFLTSVTSTLERRIQKGYEGQAPSTPDEFVKAWKASDEYAALRKEIDAFDDEFPVGGPALEAFQKSRQLQQSKRQRASSPYTLSYKEQVMLCLWRGGRRLFGPGGAEMTLTSLFGNVAMALIIGSVFYNLQHTTASFFQRSALLFFSILMAALSCQLEIHSLYAQRPIVEKQTRYAFVHPSAEAIAGILVDTPYKVGNAIFFSTTLYFLSNLRRAPGPFFYFVLISFTLSLAMSMLFRTIGAVSRSLAQALAPSAVLTLGLVLYTGFAVPTRDMLGWSSWIRWLNPVSYGFESLMINEFVGQEYPCSAFVPAGPGYPTTDSVNRICSTVGSVAGSSVVAGERWLSESFSYDPAHRWRNWGILIVYIVGLCGTFLAASEWITAKKSKGEVLVFQRGRAPAFLTDNAPADIESGEKVPANRSVSKGDAQDVSLLNKQTSILQWEDVNYEIKIKKETRKILDNVDGWVKPGTLTALMGVSGAGKTTLLDVLATRVTMGVVDGKMLVDGVPRDQSFQRKTGYVQQQDLHLETSTVREALEFSALLRQSHTIPRSEKLAYVDEVIKILEMEDYADAVVGVPGEGLNVEQRKRLTIGVELAAKPQLLLFLDEPTSGLDSQTSWAICNLLAKLTEHGQAPSALLFQRFDRLLFLLKGGRTAYFGPVGNNSETLISYFERNGGPACPDGANPAEWMLEVVGAAPGSKSDIDWHATWRNSPEFAEVKAELRRLEERGKKIQANKGTSESKTDGDADKSANAEFAVPFWTQYWTVQKRVFWQYWRTPSYIYSKFSLVIFSSLFIGFTFFRATNSIQGLQNQMFAIFMVFSIFGYICQQLMPSFVIQRSLYEARERPAKTYSWRAFMLSNIIVEIPWATLAAVFMWACIYWPIGMNNNAVMEGQVSERSGLMLLYFIFFMWFSSTFAHMMIAGMDSADTAANVANLLFSLTLIFCGILASPDTLPRFWIFLYRVSPFTYLADGFLSVGLANTDVVCSSIEYLLFQPPAGDTCGSYMQNYINASGGGYLLDAAATSDCSFCSISKTNVYLASVSSHYSHRWRNYGILQAYLVFNVCGALLLYWLARVPKKAKVEDKKKDKEETN